jgi:hypothetical protein
LCSIILRNFAASSFNFDPRLEFGGRN